MDEPPYQRADQGDRRVLTVNRRQHPTRDSAAHVIRMLIEGQGVRRAPLCLAFKQRRGPQFPDPLSGCPRTSSSRA